jgi:hypothetical protein
MRDCPGLGGPSLCITPTKSKPVLSLAQPEKNCGDTHRQATPKNHAPRTPHSILEQVHNEEHGVVATGSELPAGKSIARLEEPDEPIASSPQGRTPP